MISERQWQQTLLITGRVVLILAVVVLPARVVDENANDPGPWLVIAAWVLFLVALRFAIDALTAIVRGIAAWRRHR